MPCCARKALGTLGNKHHVRAFFKNGAGQADGILDAVQTSNGTGAQSVRVHHDRVAFNLTVEIEMRTVAGVKDRIVLKNDDSGFDGVEGVAASGEDRPAGLKCAAAPCLAGFDGVIGNVPSTTMNNQRRKHKQRGLQRRENLSSCAETRPTRKRPRSEERGLP